jgi:hypothetical protein
VWQWSLVDNRRVARTASKRLGAGERDAAFRAALEIFRVDATHGVFGIDVGPRERRGRKTRELAIRVYVETKLPTRAIPPIEFEFEGVRRTVVPDVIATGRRPLANHGVLGAFTGLHPGAKITIVAGPREIYHGAVGHLGPRDAPSWMITAGHVFPRGATDCEIWCAPAPDSSPERIGVLRRNLLDDRGLDAALVDLEDAAFEMLVPEASRPDLPWIERAYRRSELDGRRSQAFRPTAGQYTPIRDTMYRDSAWYRLESGARGGFDVWHPVRAEFLDTAEGDSGTILTTPLAPRKGFGTHSGRIGSYYLFEPLAPVLEQLGLSI